MKVADPELWLLLESFTVTVLAPAVADDGTVKVAPENEPVDPVVVVPLSVTDVPPKVAVIVDEAAKPVPDSVTVEPILPPVGFNVMDGVIMNAVVGEFVPSVT